MLAWVRSFGRNGLIDFRSEALGLLDGTDGAFISAAKCQVGGRVAPCIEIAESVLCVSMAAKRRG